MPVRQCIRTCCRPILTCPFSIRVTHLVVPRWSHRYARHYKAENYKLNGFVRVRRQLILGQTAINAIVVGPLRPALPPFNSKTRRAHRFVRHTECPTLWPSALALMVTNRHFRLCDFCSSARSLICHYDWQWSCEWPNWTAP